GLRAVSEVAEERGGRGEGGTDVIGIAARAQVHKTHARPQDLLGDLDRLLECQDEPFGGTSIYAQNRVFRLARDNGIKVMLDGQGADELLGGYHTFAAARLASLVR